jgi:hypothetical protein
MNKTTEALKMAIELLSQDSKFFSDPREYVEAWDKALNACKKALESQEQEPVVDVARVQEDGSVEWNPELPDLPVGTKLYTHPAQPLTRDWIGTALERADKDEAFRKGLIGELAQPLSDDEIRTIIANEGIPVRTGNTAIRFARAIEQAHGIGVKDE